MPGATGRLPEAFLYRMRALMTDSSQHDPLDKAIASTYEAGFVTDIESETIPPGLDEGVVRVISGKKTEPEWLTEWRLKAFRHGEGRVEPTWAHVHSPPIDFKALSYYSSPKNLKDKPKSLD